MLDTAALAKASILFALAESRLHELTKSTQLQQGLQLSVLESFVNRSPVASGSCRRTSCQDPPVIQNFTLQISIVVH